jgi:ribonuclease BN (tRNA processing enzyme)
LPLEDVPARLEYPDLSDRRLTHGGLEIAFCPVAHPGGCFAYRIQENATGTALVFATDIEWAAMDQTQRTLFLDMCRRPFPAQLLVMDGHLTLNDSAVRKGWGHSTFAEVVETARLIGEPKVILTHHDAAYDDRELDAFAMNLQDHVANHAPGLQASLARQGQVLEVQA